MATMRNKLPSNYCCFYTFNSQQDVNIISLDELPALQPLVGYEGTGSIASGSVILSSIREESRISQLGRPVPKIAFIT